MAAGDDFGMTIEPLDLTACITMPLVSDDLRDCGSPRRLLGLRGTAPWPQRGQTSSALRRTSCVVLVMHAPGDVRVEEREDPRILAPTGAILHLSATCVCGSDL